MKYIVYVDQGHAMTTAGKRTPIFKTDKAGTYQGKCMHERDFNRATGVYLMNLLKEVPDLEVLDVSPTGNESLAMRCNTANNHYKKALTSFPNVKAVFISIHANAFTGSWGTAHGIETYYYKNSVEGKKLATIVNNNLCEYTGLSNRGIKTNSLYVVSNTSMLAILCECGFMDNLNEALLLISDDYRQKCAKAMFDGLQEYLDFTKPTPVKVVTNITDIKVSLPSGIEINGKLIDDSTYVPIRFLTEELGLNISYDSKTKSVSIRRS